MMQLEKNLGGRKRFLPSKLGLVSLILLGTMAFSNIVYSQQKKEEDWRDQVVEWIAKPENSQIFIELGKYQEGQDREQFLLNVADKYNLMRFQQNLADRSKPEINIINQIPQQPVYQQPAQPLRALPFNMERLEIGRNYYITQKGKIRPLPGYTLNKFNGNIVAVKIEDYTPSTEEVNIDNEIEKMENALKNRNKARIVF